MKTTSEITLKKTETNYLEELKKPIREIVKERPGGGGTKLYYIPGKWYIERLNDIVGENWQWEVVSIQPTGISYIVHGRLTIDGISRDGIGGADLKFAKDKEKTPINVSSEGFENTVKSAETDAFKRACEKFGLGLFLSVDEESAKYAQTDDQRQEAIEEFKLIANDPNATKEEKNKAFSTLLTKKEQEIVKKQLVNPETKQLNN